MGVRGVSDTAGTGRPIVLLHGMAASKEIWEPFVEPLAREHRVVAVDLPGFGDNSDQEPGLVAQVRFVRNVIDELGLDEPALIGHSMGTLPALFTTARSTSIRASSRTVPPSREVRIPRPRHSLA